MGWIINAALGVKNVLDPFGGSGTTVLSAQEQGINAYGVDVHPFVSKIAQAKLAWDVILQS
ncbi:DNA methyltransferase [Erwinia aphidicola]|uniref:DNA methyltransferase n=1 Tax=Erwinia aphidicola TaxID=68334 RepID=UPI0030CC7E4C